MEVRARHSAAAINPCYPSCNDLGSQYGIDVELTDELFLSRAAHRANRSSWLSRNAGLSVATLNSFVFQVYLN